MPPLNEKPLSVQFHFVKLRAALQVSCSIGHLGLSADIGAIAASDSQTLFDCTWTAQSRHPMADLDTVIAARFAANRCEHTILAGANLHTAGLSGHCACPAKLRSETEQLRHGFLPS